MVGKGPAYVQPNRRTGVEKVADLWLLPPVTLLGPQTRARYDGGLVDESSQVHFKLRSGDKGVLAWVGALSYPWCTQRTLRALHQAMSSWLRCCSIYPPMRRASNLSLHPKCYSGLRPLPHSGELKR
jgi:hypothetical protein